MINEPSLEQLANIPKLYESEDMPTKDKLIHAHFFLGNSHWFIAEFDQSDTMFGFCILNGDMDMAGYGYVSLEELKSIKIHGIYEVEFDILWKPTPARHVGLIRKGSGIFSNTKSSLNRDPWTWYSLQFNR